MKRLIIVAIIAALLATYIKFVEIPEQTEEVLKQKLYTDITGNEIKSILVSSPDFNYELINSNPHKDMSIDPSEGVSDSSDKVVGKNQQTNFKLAGISDAILDRAAVESIATSIANLTFTKSIPAEEVEKDLSIYGLANPLLTVQVAIKDSKKILKFGNKNEFVNSRYMQIDNDSKLYLVNDSIFEAASKKQNDLRTKTPISFADEEVSNIIVHSSSQEVQIEPEPNKTFKIKKPDQVRAQSHAIFDLYRNLRNLQAESFFDSPTSLSDYGLDNPNGFIQVNLKDRSITIHFGSKNDKEYFQIDKKGSIYQAVGKPSEVLIKEEDSFRDGSQFKFDPFLAQNIVLSQDDKILLNLKLDKTQWKFDGNEDADSPFVKEYLKTLSGLAVSKFLPLDFKIEEKSAKYKISIKLEDQVEGDSKEITMIIGENIPNQGYPAMVLGINEPFILTNEQFKQVTPAQERFKMLATPKPS